MISYRLVGYVGCIWTFVWDSGVDGLTVQNHSDLLAMASCEDIIEKCGFAGSKISCETLVSKDSLYDSIVWNSLNLVSCVHATIATLWWHPKLQAWKRGEHWKPAIQEASIVKYAKQRLQQALSRLKGWLTSNDGYRHFLNLSIRHFSVQVRFVCIADILTRHQHGRTIFVIAHGGFFVELICLLDVINRSCCELLRLVIRFARRLCGWRRHCWKFKFLAWWSLTSSYVPFTMAINTECGEINKQHRWGQQPNPSNELAVLDETLLLNGEVWGF